MHARVGRMRVKPERLDEMLRPMRQYVTPTIQRQAGFNAILIMSNHQTGQIVVETLWENEEALQASGRPEVIQDQLSKVITFLLGPPVFEDYEVDMMS